MAKFRLPSGVGTRVLAFRTEGGRVVLRFNKKGEAQCADKYTDAVKQRDYGMGCRAFNV